MLKQSLTNKVSIGSKFKETTNFLYGKNKKFINSMVNFSSNNTKFSTEYLILLGYNLFNNSIQARLQISFLLRNSVSLGLYTNYFNSFFYTGFFVNYLNKFLLLKANINLESNFINSIYFNFYVTFSVNIGTLLKITINKTDDKFSEPLFLEYQKKFDPFYQKNYKSLTTLNLQISKNIFFFTFNFACAFYDYFLSINLTGNTNIERPDFYFIGEFSWNLKRFVFKINLNSTLFVLNTLDWGTAFSFDEISFQNINLSLGLFQKSYNVFQDIQILIDSKIDIKTSKNASFFFQSSIGAIIKNTLVTPTVFFDFHFSSGFKILF